MRDTVVLRGVVLSAQPQGEYDKRLVILTMERGKITAFARGVRRSKSPLTAVVNPFVFASFSLFEGRDAYTLERAEVADYFDGLAGILPGVFYGYYFLELASYFGREGIEASREVNLLFVTLKALMKGVMSEEMIRAVYEIRMLAFNGELALPSYGDLGDSNVCEAVRYLVSAPASKTFSFELAEGSQELFRTFARRSVRRAVDRPMKSLAVLDEL